MSVEAEELTSLARLFDPDPRPDPCEPRTEIVHRDDRLIRHRPAAAGGPWASTVVWVRWRPDEADRRIDEVLDFFATRAAHFIWSVGPQTEPRDLGDRLLARGFELVARTQLMVAALPIVGLRVNPEIVVREVRDEATMRDSLAVEHPDWEAERLEALLSERVAYLSCPERARHFAVAYLGGVPVSAARWRFNDRDSAVHLSGAETLMPYRRRGAYSTLVVHRARRALERGCRYATIFADDTTSAPILAKRGFRSVGRASYYLSPSRSSSS